MSIYDYTSPSDMYRAMAAALVSTGETAVRARGVFHLVLNGGSTPVGLYTVLRKHHVQSDIWPQTQFWFGDERSVPPDDPGSNYSQARDKLLEPLEIAESQVRRMKGELEPVEAAVHYSELLRRAAGSGRSWPRFDLVLLGLGKDGHTASLFPGSVEPEGAAVVAVTADYDGRPAERVSLTSAVINDARRIFWMVTGTEKAGIVERVLNGPRDPANIPAQRIAPARGDVDWWLSIS